MTREADDDDRYPTLTAQGRAMLTFMREHPHAPRFRNQSGNRLTSDDLSALARFEEELGPAVTGQSPPPWLPAFIRQCFDDIPHYRALGPVPATLADIQPVSRADLAQDIARFVPDPVDLSRLINFQTTGTTGHGLLVPSHPQVAGRYLSFHKRALARFGIVPKHGAGQVGVVLIGHQQTCFTYTSVTPQMGESGLAKINLHPDDWHSPDDRAAYIDALAPEFIAGDPLSFEVLLDLGVTSRPKALLSVSMMLSDGLRSALEEWFGCPVLDLYSMNEVGPIAVFDPALGAHVLLQDRLWVEVIDEHGRALPDGERGELTVTGGFNFCLPLLRYRTGDQGALATVRGERVIIDLVGRRPVRFRDATGAWRNNIEVTHALRPLPIAQYALRQRVDGTFVLSLSRGSMRHAGPARAALEHLLGPVAIAVDTLPDGHKAQQYTSDLAEPA
ncbi:AMP-binding protein [Sphingomonas sp. LY160]|uniref:AMP-binding protein n=1 Tax=Sphingomonas sp. LY160 TaxID=3095342 RepID=UPI002ADECED6|nr:AMP-binding protein [Sphingomonas sp. LY160]MEA1072933.1 hypothetical protein [Sphingomonas sp. LY160]